MRAPRILRSLTVAVTLTAGTLAAGTLAAAPSAGAAVPPASKWSGTTAILTGAPETSRLLRHGVAVIGKEATVAQIQGGKFAINLAVNSVHTRNGKVRVGNWGGLVFSVGDGFAQRSVELTDVTMRLADDPARDRITAKVYLDEATSSGGSREFLGTMTVFRLESHPSGPSSFPFTMFVSGALAKAASGHLGWFLPANTRFGEGIADLQPPG